MSDQTLDVLDPDRIVKLSTGKEITVRELNWKESRNFLSALAGRASQFFSIAPNGKTSFDSRGLMGAIITDLGETLVMSCTGMDLPEMEGLRARDMTMLLEAAISLNVRPDMIEAGKALAGRFKAIVSKP